MGYTREIRLCGISEKDVRDTMGKLPEFKQLDWTLDNDYGDITVKLSANGSGGDGDADFGKDLVKDGIKAIKNTFGINVYTTHRNITLEKTIADVLISNGLSIATVESCTGGLLSGRIINVPGISQVFKLGLVTYSNKSKRKLVGVKKSTLEKHGAVSRETALEMLKGLAGLTKAEILLSTTGIAGPDGGTEDKPVGLVYIGCMVKGNAEVKKFIFEGDRDSVRNQAVVAALNLTRECVLKYISEKIFE